VFVSDCFNNLVMCTALWCDVKLTLFYTFCPPLLVDISLYLIKCRRKTFKWRR